MCVGILIDSRVVTGNLGLKKGNPLLTIETGWVKKLR